MAEHTFTIGTIGAGQVAQTIAAPALRAGHRVVFSNSRGPDSLKDLVEQLGVNASAGTVEEAAAAQIVILAVKWDKLDAALPKDVAWNGQTLIDVTNQWHNDDPAQSVDLGERTGSEYVASLVPGAHVVKAFNTVFMEVLAKSTPRDDGKLAIFIAGDDDAAKTDVATLVQSMGLAPIDLGGLREGGRLMQAGGPLNGQNLIQVT